MREFKALAHTSGDKTNESSGVLQGVSKVEQKRADCIHRGGQSRSDIQRMHPIHSQEYLEKEKPGATIYRPVGCSGGQPFDQAVELQIAFDRLEERSQVNEAAEIGKGGPREAIPVY